MKRKTLLLSAVVLLNAASFTFGTECASRENGDATQARCCTCCVVKNPSRITAEALKNAKLLEIDEAGRRFTPDEVTVVVNFLNQGGSVFLLMDQESRTPLLDDGVALIAAPFGITFTQDLPYLHNCGGVAKAGAINKADREIPYSGGRAVTGGTPFAWRLDAEGKPAEPFACYVETPNDGRLVAFGEKMAYLGLGVPEGVRLSGVPHDASRTTYWGKDSKAFMDEVRSG